MVVRNWDEIKAETSRGMTEEEGKWLMENIVTPIYRSYCIKVIKKERDEFMSFLAQEAFIYFFRYDDSKGISLDKFVFTNTWNRAKNFLRDSYRDNLKSFCYMADSETDGIRGNASDQDDHFSRLLNVKFDESELPLEELLSTFDKRELDTVNLLLDGYALKEIEQLQGKSRTYVRRTVDLIIMRLEEYGYDMNYYEKYRQYKKRTARLGTQRSVK